jgi:hypothetical protein
MDGKTRTRAIPITNPLPDDVDQDILGRRRSRSTAVPTGFQFSGVASHVLLAACASNERAIEQGGRGAFTRAFLDTIQDMGYKNMTYSGLIGHLPPIPKSVSYTLTIPLLIFVPIVNLQGVKEITEIDSFSIPVLQFKTAPFMRFTRKETISL